MAPPPQPVVAPAAADGLAADAALEALLAGAPAFRTSFLDIQIFFFYVIIHNGTKVGSFGSKHLKQKLMDTTSSTVEMHIPKLIDLKNKTKLVGNHEGHFRFSISPDEHGRVVPGCVGGEGGGEAHEEEAEQEEEPLEAGALQEVVASGESE